MCTHPTYIDELGKFAEANIDYQTIDPHIQSNTLSLYNIATTSLLAFDTLNEYCQYSILSAFDASQSGSWARYTLLNHCYTLISGNVKCYTQEGGYPAFNIITNDNARVSWALKSDRNDENVHILVNVSGRVLGERVSRLCEMDIPIIKTPDAFQKNLVAIMYSRIDSAIASKKLRAEDMLDWAEASTASNMVVNMGNVFGQCRSKWLERRFDFRRHPPRVMINTVGCSQNSQIGLLTVAIPISARSCFVAHWELSLPYKTYPTEFDLDCEEKISEVCQTWKENFMTIFVNSTHREAMINEGVLWDSARGMLLDNATLASDLSRVSGDLHWAGGNSKVTLVLRDADDTEREERQCDIRDIVPTINLL